MKLGTPMKVYSFVGVYNVVKPKTRNHPNFVRNGRIVLITVFIDG